MNPDWESNQFQSETTIKAAAKLVAEKDPPGVIVIFILSLYEPEKPASCKPLVFTKGKADKEVAEGAIYVGLAAIGYG